MQWRGVFVGLLIAAAFVGSIDVAIRAFAIGAENTEKAASPKTQDLQIATPSPDTAKTVQISAPPDAPKTIQSLSEPKPEIDLAEGQALSISDIHPTDGFASKPSPGSLSPLEASAGPDSVTNTTHVSQSDYAAEPDQPEAVARPDQFDAMPLPTRKPEGPIAKEAPRGKAALKRIAQRGRREPKPMRFGVIGYNYNTPQ
jgi:hypothetical protein